MPTSTQLAPSSAGSRFKTILWVSLGLTTLFVFITSELLLITDYPMYHAYRLQVIADRRLLIPHTLFGMMALLIGPIQFSSRFRQRHLKIHRVLGRIYVISVFIGAATGVALASGRPGFPGTSMQAAAWVVCTTAALITARNRQIIQHRQWMARSYAVTFTFVSSRVLNLWPRYWSHLGDSLAAVGVIAFTLASLLIVDFGLNWRELTTRPHFLYRNEERSNRTKGRLWDELVVETSDGPMQRLISVDGNPLSDSQKNAEDQRITYLANHPDEFRRKNQRRKDDEARMPELLRELPNIFLFETVGSDGDYTRISFQPNPSFQEESYQDRVVHAMSGVLLIHTRDMRLCELDAHLDHRVEFGFGLLGAMSGKTHLSLAREEVSPGQWTPTKIHIHLDGSILLLKSVSRDVVSLHYGFKRVAGDLTVAEAAAILRSNAF